MEALLFSIINFAFLCWFLTCIFYIFLFSGLKAAADDMGSLTVVCRGPLVFQLTLPNERYATEYYYVAMEHNVFVQLVM